MQDLARLAEKSKIRIITDAVTDGRYTSCVTPALSGRDPPHPLWTAVRFFLAALDSGWAPPPRCGWQFGTMLPFGGTQWVLVPPNRSEVDARPPDCGD